MKNKKVVEPKSERASLFVSSNDQGEVASTANNFVASKMNDFTHKSERSPETCLVMVKRLAKRVLKRLSIFDQEEIINDVAFNISKSPANILARPQPEQELYTLKSLNNRLNSFERQTARRSKLISLNDVTHETVGTEENFEEICQGVYDAVKLIDKLLTALKHEPLKGCWAFITCNEDLVEVLETLEAAQLLDAAAVAASLRITEAEFQDIYKCSPLKFHEAAFAFDKKFPEHEAVTNSEQMRKAYSRIEKKLRTQSLKKEYKKFKKSQRK